MDEGGTVPILCRREIRKQKLMEFLAAKGKLKPPTSKPYLRGELQTKKPSMSTVKVNPAAGKENQAPNSSAKSRDTKPWAASSCAASTVSLNHIARGHNSKSTIDSTRPVPLKLKQAFTTSHTVSSLKSISANMRSVELPARAVKLTSEVHSEKSQSNATRKSKSQPSSRPTSAAYPITSRPVTTHSSRISLGPVSKTKTGLIPAVLQPRKIETSCSTVTGTSIIPTPLASRAHSSSSIPTRVTQRKTLPTTARIRPGPKTTTNVSAKGQIKAVATIGIGPNPLRNRTQEPARQNRPVATLKPAHIPPRPLSAPVKPIGKPNTKTAAHSVVQPAKVTARWGSELNGTGSARASKPGARATLGLSSQQQAKASTGTVHAALSGPGRQDKTRSCNEKRTVPDKVPPSQASHKETRASSMLKTVPQPARNVSRMGGITNLKTPVAQSRVIPQTEGKNLSKAQEERMRKLQEWREAKGICYKRPPMPVKPQIRRTVALPRPYWNAMEEEDEAHSLISAVDSSLADCIKLLEEGCPSEQVSEVLSRLPTVAQKFAKYWICQVRLMERQGNLEVLPMFEEAVRVVLEPVDELRTVVFEILKKKNENQAHSTSICGKAENDEATVEGNKSPGYMEDAMITPKPVKALICGDQGNSSVIKYKITGTPGGIRSQQKEPARVNGQEVRFFTPVRRSVRIESASRRYPAALQDHDLCVTSYNHLMAEEEREEGKEEESSEASLSVHNTPMYVYRENEALKERVNVQLVYEDQA